MESADARCVGAGPQPRDSCCYDRPKPCLRCNPFCRFYAWWLRPKPRSNSTAPRHLRPSIAKVFVIVGILDLEGPADSPDPWSGTELWSAPSRGLRMSSEGLAAESSSSDDETRVWKRPSRPG